MGSDMVVALGRATVDGHTLYAHNSHRPFGECQQLCLVRGREFTFGEKLRAQFIEIPQARQSYTVLGCQPAGAWGYSHGVNEHGVALGAASFRSNLQREQPGLVATDLVRLALERSRSARQAVDLITDLVERHGQGTFAGCPAHLEGDSTLLIADASEAFALEAAGPYWVYQQIEQVRAASDVSIVRQDWNRISHGLADQAIAKGWWPADGSKLDFAAALCANPVGEGSALRRWGRATMLLEQQNGHIDGPFLRRLLSDHYEGMRSEVDPLTSAEGPASLCRHPGKTGGLTTSASMVVQLSHEPQRPPMAWCGFGPPCIGVLLPIFLDGALPEPFGPPEAGTENLSQRLQRLHEQLRRDSGRWAKARTAFSRLQARLDQETEEFQHEAAELKQRGEKAEVQRLAGIFMQHNLELLEEQLAQLAPGAAEHVAAERPAPLSPIGR